jgi:hypothetical protein
MTYRIEILYAPSWVDKRRKENKPVWTPVYFGIKAENVEFCLANYSKYKARVIREEQVVHIKQKEE